MVKAKKIAGILKSDYPAGFQTKTPAPFVIRGLSEETIRQISAHKNEPDFLLQFRLGAYKNWLKMTAPKWAKLKIKPIDYQKIIYYSEPKQKKTLRSLDEVDPEILKTFERLGIPLLEQKRLTNVAVDAIFDSVSIATTFQKDLAKKGVIFCSFSEAVQKHPALIKKYLGSVVPSGDNFYAALNAAVFTDGSFVYVPKNTICPMELSSYFRINTENSGQFERTLIICEDNSFVSYLEGCTAPRFDSNQLHAAVVELVAKDNAEIKYATVQNWYPGDAKTGRGGIYNFVTKRGKCLGKKSKISWTQVETGSAITWKYPSCILMGEGSVGQFYSVAITNNHQQADTGTKMIHIGKNTKSVIIAKGISAGHSSNNYRGMVKIAKTAEGARNFTQCDSLIIGEKAHAGTYPHNYIHNDSAQIEHEASTTKISEDQLFYSQQRGLSAEEARSAIVNGFCQKVLKELPVEFATEANQLLALKLEGAIG